MICVDFCSDVDRRLKEFTHAFVFMNSLVPHEPLLQIKSQLCGFVPWFWGGGGFFNSF